MKKIKIYSELVYVIALFALTFAVAMLAAADFGVSVVVAPAYILSQKFLNFTFGQWTYIVQAFLFVVFCLAMKKFKIIYLVSFLTCVIYGTILDMWRTLIPVLNPKITPVGSCELWVRIVMFGFGVLLTAFAVMLFFKSYIYPQVCDLFVKGLAQKYSIDKVKFKQVYDVSCLMISVVMTLVFFKNFIGVKFGTVVIALATSVLVDMFSKLYDKFFETVPLFPKFEKLFVY